MAEKFAAREGEPRPENPGREQPKQAETIFEELEILEKPEFKIEEVFTEELPEDRGAEFFDPREPERIRKLPRGERRQKLAEYKEKLAKQKEGLTRMQEELTKEIRENPDMSKKEFDAFLEEYSHELKMTKIQETIARSVFAQYQRRHQAVEKFRKFYPKDAALYQAVFGRAPEGKIEVVKGPMTFYFRCYDSRDYAFIHSFAFLKNRELEPRDIETANLSGGIGIRASLIPELSGTIIAENTTKVVPEARERVYDHEEQHAIKKLFKETTVRSVLEEKKAESEEEKEQIVSRELMVLRENAEIFAKDEILAYLKVGKTPEAILETLTKAKEKGGLYDYLKPIWEGRVKELLEEEKSEKYKKAISRAAKNVLEEEYRTIIIRGANSYTILIEDLGYSKDQAIALLMGEPLIKWPKVVSRLYAEKIKSK